MHCSDGQTFLRLQAGLLRQRSTSECADILPGLDDGDLQLVRHFPAHLALQASTIILPPQQHRRGSYCAPRGDIPALPSPCPTNCGSVGGSICPVGFAAIVEEEEEEEEVEKHTIQ